jgi:nucleotide-binding universal stress UspA family protein
MAAIDFSDFTHTVLAYSILLGRRYDARLQLVHVTVDAHKLLEHNETILDVNALQQENTRYAEEALGNLIRDLGMQSECIVSKGDPADEISRLASAHQADIVVTATYGRSGFKRLLIGSVTEKLMKTLPCPLLTLHPPEHRIDAPAGLEMRLKKILVGCDFSPDSDLALDYALNLAQAFQADIHLCHVIQRSLYKVDIQDANALRHRLEKKLAGMVPDACRDGCNTEVALLDGVPYMALMDYAKERNVDLIVLGIRGHTLWEKLLVGSTTDRLIRHAPFPVLSVRPIQDQGKRSQ